MSASRPAVSPATYCTHCAPVDTTGMTQISNVDCECWRPSHPRHLSSADFVNEGQLLADWRTRTRQWLDLSRDMRKALIFLAILPQLRRAQWQRPSPKRATLDALARRGLARVSDCWRLTDAGVELVRADTDATGRAGGDS